MEDQATLWEEITQALAWGTKDATPVHRFNRLAKEHFPCVAAWLDQETCVARNQQLSRKEIEKLVPWHQRTNAKQTVGKLVLFSHNGITAIVDGNNRVAKYIEANSQHEIAAIVVELK